MHANKPLVSVHLLNWNFRKYVDSVLGSLQKQTYPNLDILFIDNASTDGSYEYARKKYPQLRYIRNETNLGYTGGHNIGLHNVRGKYVILLNFDIVLKPDFIDNIITYLENKPDVGSASGKLYYYDSQNQHITNRLDSTGIAINRCRRYEDRGQGVIDKGQYDKVINIFGPSGAAPCYRTKALIDVYQAHGEYLDEQFFAYLEDIDLAWRLQHRGWKSLYIPKAIGGHERKLPGKKNKGFKALFEKDKYNSIFLRKLSLRNHYWLFLKNESCYTFMKDCIYIITRETLSFWFKIFFKPKMLSAAFQSFIKFPHYIRKRRKIMKTRKTSSKYMYSLITPNKKIM